MVRPRAERLRRGGKRCCWNSEFGTRQSAYSPAYCDGMMLNQDNVFQELQRILKRHPVMVVGTGASCALDPHFGMEALAQELERKVTPGSHASQWQQFLKNLHAGRGLEQSLDAITEPVLREKIVGATGAFVASVDKEWAWRVGTRETPGPLAQILRKLVDGLPSSNPVQNIVTPNYDMLIEHTCDALDIRWTDGFAPGNICRWDWRAAEDSMLTLVRQPRGKKKEDVQRFKAHVRLHKVHGSVSWFESEGTEELVRSERAADSLPSPGWRRAMITPGRAKLEDAGRHREWFARADEVIGAAPAFLIVGYGFNDVHIEQGMKRRIIGNGCPGIVVTRDWSAKIKDWVQQSSDLWAVCQNPATGKKGTIIAGPENVESPLVCDDSDLWDFASFADAVM